MDHDLSLLEAVAQAIKDRSQRQGVAIELQVDANGGWTVHQARQMLKPLAAHQVVVLEQPLAPDLDPTEDTAGFAALHPHCPMALVATTESLASWARPDGAAEPARVAAVALNTARLDEAQAREEVERIRQTLDLPCIDPIRWGAEPLLRALLNC